MPPNSTPAHTPIWAMVWVTLTAQATRTRTLHSDRVLCTASMPFVLECAPFSTLYSCWLHILFLFFIYSFCLTIYILLVHSRCGAPIILCMYNDNKGLFYSILFYSNVNLSGWVNKRPKTNTLPQDLQFHVTTNSNVPPTSAPIYCCQFTSCHVRGFLAPRGT